MRDVRERTGVLVVVNLLLERYGVRALWHSGVVRLVWGVKWRILCRIGGCYLRYAQPLCCRWRRLCGMICDLKEVEQQLCVRESLVWVVLLFGCGCAIVLVHAHTRVNHMLDIVGPARVVARSRARVLLSVGGRGGAVEFGACPLSRSLVVCVCWVARVGVLRGAFAKRMREGDGRGRGVRGATCVVCVSWAGALRSHSSVGEGLNGRAWRPGVVREWLRRRQSSGALRRVVSGCNQPSMLPQCMAALERSRDVRWRAIGVCVVRRWLVAMAAGLVCCRGRGWVQHRRQRLEGRRRRSR